jgi:hypothetical protein
MKVKIFNGFGEYEKDIEFEEFVKSGFEYSCRAEFDIFYSMKCMVKTLRKSLNDENIKSRLKEIYKTTSWNTYMYEDRFEYLMNKAF